MLAIKALYSITDSIWRNARKSELSLWNFEIMEVVGNIPIDQYVEVFRTSPRNGGLRA